MTLAQQILWGSGFLGLCLIVQVLVLAICTLFLPGVRFKLKNQRLAIEVVVTLLVSLGFVVFALTAQVWIWAWVLIVYDILPDWNSAVYFSLVTFTSLGYGDIVLGPEVRVFTSFGSVTGLLSFGLSTAFLVATMGGINREHLTIQSNGENKRASGAP